MSELCVSPFNGRLCVAWTADVHAMSSVFGGGGVLSSDVFSFRNLHYRLQLVPGGAPQRGDLFFGPDTSRLRLTLADGVATGSPFTVTVVLVERPGSVGPSCYCQFLASERVSRLPWECPLGGNFLQSSVQAPSFTFGTVGMTKKNKFLFVVIFQEDPSPLQDDNARRPVQTECATDGPEFPSNLDSLSRDLANLLKDETLPDVKLKCGGRDAAIPAHRAVLAARSEVFAAMFRSDMAESRSGDVDVPDVDDDVIDPFLQYVYSGKIPSGVSDEVVPGLYSAADKYAVHALKETCRRRMVSCLTDENCIGYLAVADAHGDVDFKKSVIEYICGQGSVFMGDSWTEFAKKQSLLAIEVYQSFVERKTSAVHLDDKPNK